MNRKRLHCGSNLPQLFNRDFRMKAIMPTQECVIADFDKSQEASDAYLTYGLWLLLAAAFAILSVIVWSAVRDELRRIRHTRNRERPQPRRG